MIIKRKIRKLEISFVTLTTMLIVLAGCYSDARNEGTAFEEIGGEKIVSFYGYSIDHLEEKLEGIGIMNQMPSPDDNLYHLSSKVTIFDQEYDLYFSSVIGDEKRKFIGYQYELNLPIEEMREAYNHIRKLTDYITRQYGEAALSGRLNVIDLSTYDAFEKQFQFYPFVYDEWAVPLYLTEEQISLFEQSGSSVTEDLLASYKCRLSIYRKSDFIQIIIAFRF